MHVQIKLSGQPYQIDLEEPIDISIPVQFDGAQPSIFEVPKASARAYEGGGFIGDTRRGGNVNFEEYRIVPHCNGTHTECVGHISDERFSVQEVFKKLLLPATLITVTPEKASLSSETYSPAKQPDDLMITAKSLFYHLQNPLPEFMTSLIIRTVPNDDSKKSRDYAEAGYPYFSMEAMDYLSELGVKHLMVDTPSLDRYHDEGLLSAHHIYWGVPQGRHDVDRETYSRKTITEMVYMPETLADGNYIVSIQIPNFITDAAPSRIFLYKTN